MSNLKIKSHIVKSIVKKLLNISQYVLIIGKKNI